MDQVNEEELQSFEINDWSLGEDIFEITNQHIQKKVRKIKNK